MPNWSHSLVKLHLKTCFNCVWSDQQPSCVSLSPLDPTSVSPRCWWWSPGSHLVQLESSWWSWSGGRSCACCRCLGSGPRCWRSSLQQNCTHYQHHPWRRSDQITGWSTWEEELYCRWLKKKHLKYAKKYFMVKTSFIFSYSDWLLWFSTNHV